MQKSFMSISLVVIAISMLAMFIYSFFTTNKRPMKTAIKLILIDLLIAQIVAPILIMIPCTIYLFVTTGNLDKVTLTQMIMIPAQLAGQIMMGIYLWKAGYISKKKTTWSPVSAPFLICSGLAILTGGFLVSH